MSDDTKAMLLAALKRWVRGAVAGGLTQVLSVIAVNQSVSDFKTFEAWAWTIVVAFITGFFLALDKLARWQE